MGLIMKNSIPYSCGSGDNSREITYQEYMALSEEEKENGTTYYITDAYSDSISTILDTKEEIEANTEENKIAGALAVKEVIGEVNSNLDKKLSFAVINSGGSLSANTAKEFNISNVGYIIFFFLNYNGNYYTLTSLLNTSGCCTNGIITINYTYNQDTKNITVTANVNCTLSRIYSLV